MCPVLLTFLNRIVTIRYLVSVSNTLYFHVHVFFRSDVCLPPYLLSEDVIWFVSDNPSHSRTIISDTYINLQLSVYFWKQSVRFSKHTNIPYISKVYLIVNMIHHTPCICCIIQYYLFDVNVTICMLKLKSLLDDFFK